MNPAHGGAPRRSVSLNDELISMGERYPLLVGALSLAVGAAVGGWLRSTDTERRVLGPLSDTLKRTARDLVGEQIEEVKATAGQLVGEVRSHLGSGGTGSGSQAANVAPSDFETVLGGGKPPVDGGAQPAGTGTGTGTGRKR